MGREGSASPIEEESADGKKESVTTISWHDSFVWCNALSELLGYDPVYTFEGAIIRDATNTTAGNHAIQEERDGFRLPTSVEWELAARYQGEDSSYGAIEYPAGSSSYWTKGSYASGATADYLHEKVTKEVAWYRENSSGKTQDVGLKPPLGNHLGLFDMSGNVWEWTFTQRGVRRIDRGGAFSSTTFHLQIGQDVATAPAGNRITRGFRLVKTSNH